MAKTLYDKLWDAHLVAYCKNEQDVVLYIDRHIIHEVTSPQAFSGLREQHRQPRRISANIAMPDHNVPTLISDRKDGNITDPTSRIQVLTLDNNCQEFNIKQFTINDPRQGIVHIVAPETGAILPGMTVVCGDSHTSTHGAFACLAQGIGTSEVEHVLATQTLISQKIKNMRVILSGKPSKGVTAKDVALAMIGKIGTSGGTGYVIEFSGSYVGSISMEARMTLCNMSIEAGARVGLIAVDDTTIDYVRNRPYAPRGEEFTQAEKYWRSLVSDKDAQFDFEIEIDVSKLAPQITWGTSPEMVISIDSNIPALHETSKASVRENQSRALQYMGFQGGESIQDIAIDVVFIGSCTNSRIEDLRAAAEIVKGLHIAKNIQQALVVPGSTQVKMQAEQEGLDKIFTDAGFQWRAAGCSMCLAMNADKLQSGQRCASTSNRNFEGRQGFGGRTHLVSPIMAAAAAISGHFVDVREYL